MRLKYAKKIPCSFVLVQRFLIIRFSSIGDIVLTSPIVRCLAAKYPEAEIHYLKLQTLMV
jgi:hypothetical protein